MISDMMSGYSAMNNSFHRYAKIIKKASAHSRSVVSHSYRECSTGDSEFSNPVCSDFRFDFSVEITKSVSTTASTYYTWLFTRYAPVLGILQGPGEVLGTIWELIPYSFVVDWVLGVSDFLSTFRYTPGLLVKGHTLTQVAEYKKTVKCLAFQYRNLAYTKQSFGDNVDFIVRRKLRTVPSGMPGYPAFNLNRPDIKHIVDSLSLSMQRLLGR